MKSLFNIILLASIFPNTINLAIAHSPNVSHTQSNLYQGINLLSDAKNTQKWNINNIEKGKIKERCFDSNIQISKHSYQVKKCQLFIPTGTILEKGDIIESDIVVMERHASPLICQHQNTCPTLGKGPDEKPKPGKDYDDLPGPVQNLLTELDIHASKRMYWKTTFDHTDSLLQDVGQSLTQLAKSVNIEDPAIALLFDYIRAHNYYKYTEVGYLQTKPASVALSKGMLDITNMPSFGLISDSAAKVYSGYAVALQGQMFGPFRYFVSHNIDSHLAATLWLLNLYTWNADNISGNYYFGSAIFETLNILDYMSYQSELDIVANTIGRYEKQILNNLKSLGQSSLSLWDSNGDMDAFVLNNVIDALSRPFYLYYWSGKESQADAYLPKADQTLLEILTWHDLRIDNSDFDEQYKISLWIAISDTYANLTRRTPEVLCGEGVFGQYCKALTMDELFEPTYKCSETLKMRIQKDSVSQAQKNKICFDLGEQEKRFHHAMRTQNLPVEDDYNADLELIIFASPDDWRLYGSYLFNVSTNNGGIYIEGDPAREDNQARFFAHLATWKDEFEVWNLKHEYTHYLDGRFNQYGAFGHYPENRTTWWSEGVAEYLANGQCFARGLDEIEQSGTIPSLQSILYLTYSDTTAMIYSWSYSVHRYMNERGLSEVWRKFASAMRNPNREMAVDSTNRILKALIAHRSDDFKNWVEMSLIPWWKANKDLCNDLPRFNNTPFKLTNLN